MNGHAIKSGEFLWHGIHSVVIHIDISGCYRATCMLPVDDKMQPHKILRIEVHVNIGT